MLDGAHRVKQEEDMPWISVNDRLPDRAEHDWVLVQIKFIPEGYHGVPYIAELRSNGWFSHYDIPLEIAISAEVTHWMPLPEPPQT